MLRRQFSLAIETCPRHSIWRPFDSRTMRLVIRSFSSPPPRNVTIVSSRRRWISVAPILSEYRSLSRDTLTSIFRESIDLVRVDRSRSQWPSSPLANDWMNPSARLSIHDESRVPGNIDVISTRDYSVKLLRLDERALNSMVLFRK